MFKIKTVLFLLSMGFNLQAIHCDENFTAFQSRDEIKKGIQFLITPAKDTGAGYIGTAGKLNGKFLPFSYYSTPDYWGAYVSEELGNNCEVKDVFSKYDYTITPEGPGKELQYERINVFNGTDIYDAATWQIALALAADDKITSSSTLFDYIENQNLLLFYGHDGRHPTTPVPLGINRAITTPDGLFSYNGQSITSPENAFFFRMVSQQWLAIDPFKGTKYESNITTENFPKDNKDYELGKVTWADWKPITGENAWAFLIGPLQADYLKSKVEGKNYVSFDSISMQNAVNVLSAFQSLQAKIGGIYYATAGSLGNVGDDAVNPYEISVENNASALGGLWILQDLLKLSLKNEPGLTYAQKKTIRSILEDLDVMLYGGTTPFDSQTDGLISFFKNYAWDKNQGAFLQGGLADDPKAKSKWIPAYAPKAVDVQTWTITVLGQPTVDEWHGFGAAFRAWEKCKEWGAFVGPDRTLWGVGYSDVDGNGLNGDYNQGIMSAEWTAGAINLARALIVQYGEAIKDPNLSDDNKDEAKQFIVKLKSDEKSMTEHLLSLRTDTYAKSPAYDSVRPKNYDNLISLSNDKLAFLYSSKRYFIPFGWYGNPLPSTCSTSWAIMLHYNFNPFQLGGSYHSITH